MITENTHRENEEIISYNIDNDINKIKRYGTKYCINDVISYCNLSKNPILYMNKIDSKTLYNNDYYITKLKLVDILNKSKNKKGKLLLEEITKKRNKNDINVTTNSNNIISNDNKKNSNNIILNENKSKFIVNNNSNNIIDFSNNILKYNNTCIKYFYYNDNIYYKAKDVALMLNYKSTSS